MSKSNSRSIFALLWPLAGFRNQKERNDISFRKRWEMRWHRYINQKEDTFIYRRERRDHNYDYQPHVHNSNPSSQLILWVGPMTWKIKRSCGSHSITYISLISMVLRAKIKDLWLWVTCVQCSVFGLNQTNVTITNYFIIFLENIDVNGLLLIFILACY